MKAAAIIACLLLAGCTSYDPAALVRANRATLPRLDRVGITNSMHPYLRPGQGVVILPVSFDDMRAAHLRGERVAVSYWPAGHPAPILHEVIGWRGDCAIAKGTNNPRPDSAFVTRQNYIGVAAGVFPLTRERFTVKQ